MRTLLLFLLSTPLAASQTLVPDTYPSAYSEAAAVLEARGPASSDSGFPPTRDRPGLSARCADPVYCRRLAYSGLGLVTGTVGAVVFVRMYLDVVNAGGDGRGEAALVLPLFEVITGSLALASGAVAVGSGFVLGLTLWEGPQRRR